MVELLKSFSGKAGKPLLQAAARSRQSCLKPVFMGIPWFVSHHFDGVVAGAERTVPARVITTTARTAIDYAHRLNATMRDQTPLGPRPHWGPVEDCPLKPILHGLMQNNAMPSDIPLENILLFSTFIEKRFFVYKLGSNDFELASNVGTLLKKKRFQLLAIYVKGFVPRFYKLTVRVSFYFFQN